MKYMLVSVVAVGVVMLDQLTKWIIREHVPLYDSIVVFPSFFQITHLKNTGGAFGIFAGAHDALRLPFFLSVSVIAFVVLLYFVRRVPAQQRLLLLALGGILGGALGNFIDRVVAGEVTDFLYFHWRDYYWPAFNFADSFISIGMVVLLGYSFFGQEEK
jgi:signal peptidase II